jgi:hypothetical protein
LLKFDFDHPTPKLDIIFDHRSIKTVHFDHPTVLEGGFADVEDTWMWDPLVITFLSLLSFSFSLASNVDILRA